MIALTYLRVSTREQADSGLGLEAQRYVAFAEGDAELLSLWTLEPSDGDELPEFVDWED